MAVLKLEVVGKSDALSNLQIDGKRVKLKKNRRGPSYCEVEVAGNVAEITVLKSHHYGGKNWFWWNLLCFVISVFGLFDIRQNARFLVVDFACKINLTENTCATLKIRTFEDRGQFIDVQSENGYEVSTNIVYFDKDAQVKHKKMKKAKIGFAIVTLALVAILVVVL